MSDAKILVTGATGFLGGAVLARGVPLGIDRPARYLVPVRAANEAEARARLFTRLSRFLDAERCAERLAECDVVCADLQDASSLESPAFDDVTHAIHLAANTSFISGKGVWETNFHGTLALARRLARVEGLERFVYVGTAMVCGDEPPPIVHEDAFPSADTKHLVPYTESKAAVELAIARECPDLPLIIARPSIVVGHTELGCLPSGSIFWVMRALDRIGIVSASFDDGIDIVPVDWVADGLLHLTFARSLKHRTYHLSAGTGSRTRIGELVAAMAAAEGRVNDPSRFDFVPSEEIRRFRPRLAEYFGRAHGRRMEMALGLYLGFCELDVTFDNARILEEGLSRPPSLTEYVHVCLERPKNLDIVAQAADEL